MLPIRCSGLNMAIQRQVLFMHTILQQVRNNGRNNLTEHEAKNLLSQFGVPTVAERIVATGSEAAQAAEETGFPVVLKAMGANLTHKTERNLVRVGLSNPESVRVAAGEMATAAGEDLEGFLVQPLVSGHRELVAGLFTDPQFGPVIMFGLGGVLTEALSDVSFRVAPLSESDALEMMGELRAKAVLGPFRGQAPVDQKGVTDVLLGLSRLALEEPYVKEVDINPLKVTPDGRVLAVDALVVMGSDPFQAPKRPAVDPGALGAVFHPKSIAFVGASATLGKWGHMLVVSTIHGGYQGDIYLVNPRGGTIAGRKVYKTVNDIPGPVGLAVVTVPAARVPDLIPFFQEKGIKNVLLITSGFREIGKQGEDLENKLVEQARQAGILLVGPNTMGISNPHIQLNCTCLNVNPRPGFTALLSQSGNMGSQFLGFAEQQGIGIRGFCGSGNEAMMAVEDFLDAFATDDLTRTVMLYIESVKNGPRFLESARRLGQKKPVVMLKGGETKEGNKAASSHTGALSSDARVFEAVCRQAGIVKVETSMELLDLAAGFSTLPLPKGSRAGIVTLGGGWGVVTADLCARHHVLVPELSSEIIQEIDKLLPPFWSRSNPVDLVGEQDNSVIIKAIEALMAWEGCDAVINLGIMGRKIMVSGMVDAVRDVDPDYPSDFLESVQAQIQQFETDYVQHLARLMEKYQKPIIGVSLLGEGPEKTVYRIDGFEYGGVFFSTPERAVKTLSKMQEYQAFLKRQS